MLIWLPLFYRYVDFTSLYPWCNKNTYNVVGHPQIITENFADVSTYFGLIKCTVLPPRGLFHPVLPYRTQDKLMFPLCKTCADTLNQNPCTHTDEERAILGTWCHVELMKAIEKGYEVLEMHEVWHWEETTNELFSDYVNTFLKLKQEASGYPKHCVTDEQKQRYIEPGRLLELLDKSEYEVADARLVNDETVEVQYRNMEEFEEPNNKVNIVIAAFTTAYARLKLYDLLDQLQEQVLYYDTDSVIYVHEPGKPEPPLGDYLGDLTDELDGDYITAFMSCGPKNYAYQTNDDKRVTKVRGITMNYATTKKLNLEVMRSVIHLYVNCGIQAKVTVDNPFKITRDKKNKKIITKRTKKDYRIVYNKRVVKENYGTVPYGY